MSPASTSGSLQGWGTLIHWCDGRGDLSWGRGVDSQGFKSPSCLQLF